MKALYAGVLTKTLSGVKRRSGKSEWLSDGCKEWILSHMNNLEMCFQLFFQTNYYNWVLTTFAYVRPLRMMGMFTDGLTGTMKRSLHCHEHRRLKNKIELNGVSDLGWFRGPDDYGPLNWPIIYESITLLKGATGSFLIFILKFPTRDVLEDFSQ